MIRRCMTKELEDKARKELNEDERRDEHLHDLRIWINETHPHEEAGDIWLINYLRGCKYDQARARDKLKNYYALRSTTNLLYGNRDPFNTSIQEVISRGILLLLPSPDKEIILVRWAECDTSVVTLLNVIKVGIMIMDAYLNDCSTCLILGFNVIIDCSGLPFSFITQMSPTLIKNVVSLLFKAYPMRIKGIYVVNSFTVTQILYNLMKPFLHKKIISRTHFYGSNNFNEIQKHIPLSAFPKEYGGEAGTVASLIGNVQEILEQRRNWFLKELT